MSINHRNLEFLSLFLISTLVVVLFGGCSRYSNNNSEGFIEYEISYVDFDKQSNSVSLMPQTMVMYFKDHLMVSKIESIFSFFTFSQLYQLEKGETTLLLKIMDKKFKFSSVNPQEILQFSDFKQMKIDRQGLTKQIAGFKCKKALAYPTKGAPPIEVYYTDEIKIEEPNKSNPYREIGGMLMQFEIKMNNIHMRLKASKVRFGKVAEKEFSVPAEFKAVSVDEMKKQLYAFSGENQM